MLGVFDEPRCPCIELRWREWMGRVEAVVFAASEPVPREVLARVVGKNCNLELIIDDIRAELAGRPYELVSVAGGWQHRTRKVFGDAIHAAFGTAAGEGAKELPQAEALVSIALPTSTRSPVASSPALSARRCRAT